MPRVLNWGVAVSQAHRPALLAICVDWRADLSVCPSAATGLPLRWTARRSWSQSPTLPYLQSQSIGGGLMVPGHVVFVGHNFYGLAVCRNRGRRAVLENKALRWN
jgi:hypothetical protein